MAVLDLYHDTTGAALCLNQKEDSWRSYLPEVLKLRALVRSQNYLPH